MWLHPFLLLNSRINYPGKVPSTGLEPARLATPPPQDGVSTNFTNWAEKEWVPRTGLEPAHLAAPPPEDGASTNFAIWAFY